MRSSGGESVDQILDAGAGGLRYFEVFGPRYREWTGHDPAGGDYYSLAARYDQQRGMNLDALDHLATVLGEELAGCLEDQASAQTTRFRELTDHWNGSPAADNAQQLLADTGTKVNATVNTLNGVYTAASAAVTAIEDCVRRKAETVNNEFEPSVAAGKTPPQIDWFIDLAHGRGDTSQGMQDRLRSELSGYYIESSDPVAACRNWLDEVFVAEIEAKVARFTAVCADTHTAVTSAYEQLIGAVETVGLTAFVSPGGTPSAHTDLAFTAGGPSYLTAVGSAQVAPLGPDDETSPVGQNLTQTSAGVQWNPEAQGTPSSLALTTTPASTQISETAGLDTGSKTSTSVGADDSQTTGVQTPAREDPRLGTNDSNTSDSASPALAAFPAGPSATAGTHGEWTPADITAMVTAIGTITGTIPDLITAVSGLAGNLDEIIRATGEATAAIIDATDNQPSTSAVPPETEVPAPDIPEDLVTTGDGSQEEEPILEDSGEEAPNESAGMPERKGPTGTQPQILEDPIREEAQGPQVPASTSPLEAVAGTDPAIAPIYSSLRLAPTRRDTTAGYRTAPTPSVVSSPEQESTLSL